MLHKNTKRAHTMKVYIVAIQKKPNKFVPLVLELIHPKFYASPIVYIILICKLKKHFWNIVRGIFYLSIFCIIKDK